MTVSVLNKITAAQVEQRSNFDVDNKVYSAPWWILCNIKFINEKILYLLFKL